MNGHQCPDEPLLTPCAGSIPTHALRWSEPLTMVAIGSKTEPTFVDQSFYKEKTSSSYYDRVAENWIPRN